ncbi:MAG: type II toxin-antitoxin system prevent-host-death family antitoxin [Chloroflexota bacterium]
MTEQVMVGLVEARKNMGVLLERARKGEAVLILNRSSPAAYLVNYEHYNRMRERLEEYEFRELATQAAADEEAGRVVELAEVMASLRAKWASESQ